MQGSSQSPLTSTSLHKGSPLIYSPATSVLTRTSSSQVLNAFRTQTSNHKKQVEQSSNSTASLTTASTSSNSSANFWDLLSQTRINLESLEAPSYPEISSSPNKETPDSSTSLSNPSAQENIPQGPVVEDFLTMDVGIQKNVVRSSHIDQELPICASLKFKTPANFEKTPVDLIVLVAKNLSMSGKYLSAFKSALTALMNKLGEKDRLSVIAYCHEAEVVTDLLYMTPENKLKTVQAINLIQTDIGSNILEGLKLSFKALKARTIQNPSSGIYLLSNGSDRLDIADVELLLSRQNFEEEFTIHTFGIGKLHDSELLCEIANLKSGEYYYISDLGTLNLAFLGSLGMLASTIGTDANLTFTAIQHPFFSEKVELHRMLYHSVNWLRDQSRTVYRTLLSQVHADENLNFVVELYVPPIDKKFGNFEKKIPIIAVDFEFKTLQGKVLRTSMDIEINLLNHQERCKKISFPNDHVLHQYFRVKSSAMAWKAFQKADINDVLASRELLVKLKQEINESHVNRDKYIKDLLADIDEAMDHCIASDYQEDGKHRILSIARALGAEKYCHFSHLEFSTSFRDEYQI